jgi:hypothetical protein
MEKSPLHREEIEKQKYTNGKNGKKKIDTERWKEEKDQRQKKREK